LNAKDLLKEKEEVVLKRKPRAWLSTMEILRLGLMIVIPIEMCQLRQTQVEQELGKLDRMDHSQE